MQVPRRQLLDPGQLHQQGVVLLVINVFPSHCRHVHGHDPGDPDPDPILPIVKGFGMTGIHFGVMMVVNWPSAM